jgi:hypothetical protein
MIQESFENGGGNDRLISGTFFSCGNIERGALIHFVKYLFCQKLNKNARGSTKRFVSTYSSWVYYRDSILTNFDFRFGIINFCFGPF